MLLPLIISYLSDFLGFVFCFIATYIAPFTSQLSWFLISIISEITFPSLFSPPPPRAEVMGWSVAEATGLAFVCFVVTLVCCQPTELILGFFVSLPPPRTNSPPAWYRSKASEFIISPLRHGWAGFYGFSSRKLLRISEQNVSVASFIFHAVIWWYLISTRMNIGRQVSMILWYTRDEPSFIFGHMIISPVDMG